MRQLYDASGNVGYAASYDPYGVPLAQTGSLTSPLGFTGEYTDPSGLIYLRARYMHPTLGAFLTRDPVLGVVGGESVRWNSYLYAGGNPTNYLDPDGRFFFMPLLVAAGAGALFGGLAAGVFNVAGQLLSNGGSWNCLDLKAVAGAMLEGALTGALSGAVGFGVGALGLSGVTGWAAGEAADFGAGVLWDMAVHGESLETAAYNNLLGFGIGGVIGVAGHAVGKVWRASGGPAVVDGLAKRLDADRLHVARRPSAEAGINLTQRRTWHGEQPHLPGFELDPEQSYEH